YQDRLKNAGDFRFFLVGSFKREDIKDLVLTYLGSLPDEDRRESMKVHAWPSHKARKEVQKRDGGQERTSISMFYNKELAEGVMPPAKERFAWDLFASAAQMHFLSIFREELGDSYSVSMESDFAGLWTHAVARLALQCAPDRAAVVQKRAEEELLRIAKEGV